MGPCSPAAMGGPRSGTATFFFPSVRVRWGMRRFELSVWDNQPTITVFAFAAAGLLPLLVRNWSLTLAVLVTALAAARTTLVVTRDGAWMQQDILGVVWKEHALGRMPRVATDGGWDWNELCVTPAEARYRKGLHDDERAVLLEWNWAEPNTQLKDLEADRLAQLANDEIARLHAY